MNTCGLPLVRIGRWRGKGGGVRGKHRGVLLRSGGVQVRVRDRVVKVVVAAAPVVLVVVHPLRAIGVFVLFVDVLALLAVVKDRVVVLLLVVLELAEKVLQGLDSGTLLPPAKRLHKCKKKKRKKRGSRGEQPLRTLPPNRALVETSVSLRQNLNTSSDTSVSP